MSLWVQVDVVTGRISTLDDEFHRIYGAAADGRRVSARLSLPGLAADAESRPWAVRAVDVDVLGHVNNAAQWAILEEALVNVESDRNGVAEIEYLAPVDAADSPATLHLAGSTEWTAWLFAHDALCTIARWRPTPTVPGCARGARHRADRYCPRRAVSVGPGDAPLCVISGCDGRVGGGRATMSTTSHSRRAVLAAALASGGRRHHDRDTVRVGGGEPRPAARSGR